MKCTAKVLSVLEPESRVLVPARAIFTVMVNKVLLVKIASRRTSSFQLDVSSQLTAGARLVERAATLSSPSHELDHQQMKGF
jgi:hypothetical protein